MPLNLKPYTLHSFVAAQRVGGVFECLGFGGFKALDSWVLGFGVSGLGFGSGLDLDLALVLVFVLHAFCIQV